jgi:abortive infection bacteriophage resistance protein
MRILGGFFLFYRYVMEKYNKPPLSCSQQIDLLANRGLVVSNREQAEKFLNQINYYRFSAYKKEELPESGQEKITIEMR